MFHMKIHPSNLFSSSSKYSLYYITSLNSQPTKHWMLKQNVKLLPPMRPLEIIVAYERKVLKLVIFNLKVDGLSPKEAIGVNVRYL